MLGKLLAPCPVDSFYRVGVIMPKRRQGLLAVSHAVIVGCAGIAVGLIPQIAIADMTSTGDGTQIANGGINGDGTGGAATAASAPTTEDPTNANANAQANGGIPDPETAAFGGDATAGAYAISSSSDNAVASATAIAGDGSSDIGFAVNPTNGGYGGNAYGLALASAGSAPSQPNATASVDVEGGWGGASAYGNGGNGGTATIPEGDVVQATSAAGVATASAYVVGGSGGHVKSDSPFLSSSLPIPSAGIGQSASLGNVVAGSGITVILSQTAVGGNGGENDFSDGILGASGTSVLNLTSVSNAGTLTGTTTATGGSGGFGGGGFIENGGTLTPVIAYGGTGADAIAITVLGTVGSPVTANAYSTGGAGGDSFEDRPGQGGNATADATAETGEAGVPATANAKAQGGAGGNNENDAWDIGGESGPGADGGYASANAVADLFTGQATVTATATGGNGGFAIGVAVIGALDEPYVGGAGGLAVATATGSSIFDSVTLTAVAQGGTGGTGSDGAINGIGGDATAIISGPITGTIEQFSPGLANGQGGIASLSIGSGTINVGSPAQPINIGTLSVTIPGTLTLAGDIVNGNLVVGDGTSSTTLQLPTNNGGSSLSSLTINTNSTLDIANNHLIINYADGTQAAVDAAIRGYLINGYNGGTWTGSSGLGAGGSLDSSTAANSANNAHYGLGYADGADGIVAGLSSGQIEIMYTLYGDANLDGVVSGDDFTILVGNLGKSVSGWDQGDFNYDGVVSGDDFTLLVGNLGKAANGADVTLPATDIAAIDAFAAANGLMADVPEPGNTGLALIAGIGFLYPRRRSQVGRL